MARDGAQTQLPLGICNPSLKVNGESALRRIETTKLFEPTTPRSIQAANRTYLCRRDEDVLIPSKSYP